MNFHRLDRPWSTADRIVVAVTLWGFLVMLLVVIFGTLVN